VYCTELEAEKYWDEIHESTAQVSLESISSLIQVNDQDVHEVVGYNEPLPSPDMSDINVEDEPLTTDSSNSCETCLDHSVIHDDMIQEMNDLLDMTLEFETTQLRPPSELLNFDDSMPLLSSINEQSPHINASYIVPQSVCAGQEQESTPPSTFKDDGFLRRIITRSKSRSVEFLNFLNDCLAHFADSNDLIIRDIVNALQDNISVVITDRENPYPEAPSSPDPECLPLKEEELKIEPKFGTSECIETTLLLKIFSEFYLHVVSDSPWDTKVETSSVTGESYLLWMPQAIQWRIFSFFGKSCSKASKPIVKRVFR
jgi:hypothetical protein